MSKHCTIGQLSSCDGRNTVVQQHGGTVHLEVLDDHGLDHPSSTPHERCTRNCDGAFVVEELRRVEHAPFAEGVGVSVVFVKKGSEVL